MLLRISKGCPEKDQIGGASDVEHQRSSLSPIPTPFMPSRFIRPQHFKLFHQSVVNQGLKQVHKKKWTWVKVFTVWFDHVWQILIYFNWRQELLPRRRGLTTPDWLSWKYHSVQGSLWSTGSWWLYFCFAQAVAECRIQRFTFCFAIWHITLQHPFLHRKHWQWIELSMRKLGLTTLKDLGLHVVSCCFRTSSWRLQSENIQKILLQVELQPSQCF